MPYVITASRPYLSLGSEARVVVSRRAVATLEEAWNYANNLSVAASGEWTSIGRVPVELTESGGTIGLPDGTTIEVEGVSLVDIYERAGFKWDAHGPDAMVGLSQACAAFNEAQA